MSDAREQQIADLVGPIVAEHGADVEFVTIRKAGRRSVVVVAVDVDGGITLDQIAEFTPRVSEALDEADVMGETPYTLELTSPGVGRPLTLPRHWRRAQNRLVQVQLSDDSELTGRVMDADDQHVTLSLDGQQRVIDYADIAKAVVQVEFGEAGA